MDTIRRANESEPRNPSVAYEPKDVNAFSIFRYGVGLLLTVIVAHLVVWGVFRSLNAREAHNAVPVTPLRSPGERVFPPEPRLQGVPGHEIEPQAELRQVRQAEDEVLNGYGWVDEKGGIAHIPIEETIKMLAEKGLPVAQSPPAEKPNPQKATTKPAKKPREKKP